MIPSGRETGPRRRSRQVIDLQRSALSRASLQNSLEFGCPCAFLRFQAVPVTRTLRSAPKRSTLERCAVDLGPALGGLKFLACSWPSHASPVVPGDPAGQVKHWAALHRV